VKREEALAKFRQTAPPFERGNTAALRHGGWSVVALQDRAAEIADALRSEIPGGQHAGDEPVLALLALTLARIESATAWIEGRGTLVANKKTGEIWPLLKVIGSWENSALRLANELGLSPRSRAALRTERTADALGEFMARRALGAGDDEVSVRGREDLEGDDVDG
jgi:hypothetical protein